MTKPMTKAQIEANLAKLDVELASAIESASTMRERIQHALVATVSHWKMTGSNAGLMDRMNSFLTELGQGVNLKAVKAWMEKHLHMVEDVEGKRMVFTAIKADKLDTKAAAAEKWWSLKPQQVFSFDLVTAIIALADKAAKAAEKGENDQEAEVNIDPALYQSLQEMKAKAEKAKEATYVPNH